MLPIVISLVVILQGNISSYPGWFVNQPVSSSKLYAIGYSRRFYDDETSFRHARESAHQRLDLLMGSMYLLQTDRVENDWGELLRSDVRKEASLGEVKLFVIDSILTSDMALVFASTSPELETKEYLSVRFSKDPPRWIDFPQENKEFIYSIGIAPVYLNEANSWLEAEKNSRFSLAENIRTSIKSLTRIHGESRTTIVKVQTKIILKKIEVVKRWRDDKNCFVFTRIKLINTEML